MLVVPPEFPAFGASLPEPEQAGKKLVNKMQIAKRQSEA
jgi:hypothetical protein